MRDCVIAFHIFFDFVLFLEKTMQFSPDVLIEFKTARNSRLIATSTEESGRDEEVKIMKQFVFICEDN